MGDTSKEAQADLKPVRGLKARKWWKAKEVPKPLKAFTLINGCQAVSDVYK